MEKYKTDTIGRVLKKEKCIYSNKELHDIGQSTSGSVFCEKLYGYISQELIDKYGEDKLCNNKTFYWVNKGLSIEEALNKTDKEYEISLALDAIEISKRKIHFLTDKLVDISIQIANFRDQIDRTVDKLESLGHDTSTIF